MGYCFLACFAIGENSHEFSVFLTSTDVAFDCAAVLTKIAPD
jgi:hypothetical protein